MWEILDANLSKEQVPNINKRFEFAFTLILPFTSQLDPDLI